MKPNFGLKPLSHDTDKDFKLGAIYNLPSPDTLPLTFRLGESVIENQGETDKCTAFGTGSASEFQEGVQLNPDYTFALIKHLDGNPDLWGASLKDAMASHVKFGAVKKEATTLTSRYLKDYPKDLLDKAKEHQKQTYLSISAPFMDAFDAIRSFLYKFREEKRAVIIGVEFGWQLNEYVLSEPKQGFGHCMYIIGWQGVMEEGEPYLIAVNSYGKEAGRNGEHLISRKVINQYVGRYGAYAFVDKPREDIEYMLENGIKEGDSWLISLWKVLVQIALSPFQTKQEKLDTAVKLITEVAEKNVPKVKPETPKEMVLRVCKEQGLTQEQTKNVFNTINCESKFNNEAINYNKKNDKVVSIDYGICQINDYWHIGAGKTFPSVEYVKNNPDKVVEWMCKMCKAGKLGLWVCWKERSGKTKQWMVDEYSKFVV